jgi:GNAT superfamily N-acetyltransferase
LVSVALRPMSADEYASYVDHSMRTYAEQMSELGGVDRETAQAEAERTMSELLPDGRATEGQHLLVAESEGARVGIVWVGRRLDRPDLWWVWDVEIDERMQGRGLGRAAMIATEAYVRAQGVTRLGLNVFGGNAVARSLYDSLGYVVDAQQMSKPLL